MHSSYFAKLLAHDWLYGHYHVCHLYYSRYLVPFIFIMFFYIRLQKYLLFIKHYALYHSFFSCRANWGSDLLVSLLLEGTDLQDMFWSLEVCLSHTIRAMWQTEVVEVCSLPWASCAVWRWKFSMVQVWYLVMLWWLIVSNCFPFWYFVIILYKVGCYWCRFC